MNVAPVFYNSSVSMMSKKSDAKNNFERPLNMAKNYSPLTVGTVNGACWFGIGFLFDKMCKVLFKSSMSNKSSLMVNGAVGILMGTYSFFKAKQLQKTEQMAKIA